MNFISKIAKLEISARQSQGIIWEYFRQTGATCITIIKRHKKVMTSIKDCRGWTDKLAEIIPNTNREKIKTVFFL